MKFCPTCQTRYDEEILRFCTKDGTPLVEENQPAFTETELPSESVADDFGEETVIRRNPPPPTSSPVVEEVGEISSPPRIVIPTAEAEKIVQPTSPPPPPHVRARSETVYQPAPRRTNTGKIVILTLLGTFLVLGGIGVIYLMSRRSADDNKNVNANFNATDSNLNSNLSIGNSPVNLGGSENSNTNANSNFNINVNAAATKTPTPRPTASPTATPIVNSNLNNTANANASPTPRPSVPPPPPPLTTPRPSPSATPPPDSGNGNSNRLVNAGVLNGRAVNLPKPAYPPLARQMRASGQVAVQILIDEAGNVTAAKATTGNPLLRASAEAAARQSKINPIRVGDRAVSASGILIYNFINQ